jgi:hypothetical protein
MTAQGITVNNRSRHAGRAALLGALLAIAAVLLPVASAQAAEPAWSLTVAPLGGGGYFPPGANGNPTEGPGFVVTATNTGDGSTAGTYTITDTLPQKPGETSTPAVTPGTGISGEDDNGNALSCGTVGQTITCTGTVPLAPGEKATVTIPVNVPEDALGGIVDEAKVQGGGVIGVGVTGSSPEVFLTSNRPAWAVSLVSAPTNLAGTGSKWAKRDEFFLDFSNVGGAPSSGTNPIVVTVHVSAGLTPKSTQAGFGSTSYGDFDCEVGKPTAQDFICTTEESILLSDHPDGAGTTNHRIINFYVDPGALPDGSPVSAEVTITGGGAHDAQDATNSVVDSTTEAPFDFLPGQNGLGSMLTGGDGLPATQAGSHPGVFTTALGFPTSKGGVFGGFIIANDGGVHNARAFLPPGLILNPEALVEHCFEAQMEQDDCPRGSQVGIAGFQLNIGFGGMIGEGISMYSLDSPPGYATSFSFDAGGVGIYPHVLGRLRDGGNYALAAISNDILSLGPDPVMGFRFEFWDNATDPIYHNYVSASKEQEIPLFSLPTSCGGTMELEAEMDSWGHQGEYKQRISNVTDSVGNPTGVTGCNALEFSPSLEARPTTNVADAPSGLDVDLKVPQNEDFNTLATSHLKKAVVKLPEGLVINPAGANGLDSCSSTEIGIDPGTGVPDGVAPSCPEASRIGSVSVETPLLDHPLPGSIYLATPHDNPFDSMLATYVVVQDARSGTLIKLASELEADPVTGQLTATFDDQPQLPFGDLQLHFFGGAAAVLRTPALCGKYTTTSSITPWSGGLPETPSDNYEISNSPSGGTCPKTTASQPNAPSFDAGTIVPVAGAHSPLVVNLRRPDGSQQFSSVTVTPPPGLLGKLAGIPYCPDSALAAAAAKTGNQEKASPSCPAASKVGTVDVGTGAGPAPYYIQGGAYLTGPYKGAPIGLAVVTPAVAGAYDLGTVVVRAALRIDPATAAITATSDNLPTILQGIPLDIRSVQIKLDRPDFTLNPTNCDAMSFTGQLLTTLGQPTALLSRFQLAECVNLGFKPSLSLRLKGGTKRTKNPALIATLKAREGDANIGRAQVKLPAIALLDNSHIGTVCSRVQFAADQCPPDSIYGSAEATSPLLDYTASGPVYLRANPEHELPDLVAALNGPASQPIEVDLAGKTDAVKGALRNTFEAVPDVPVSTFRLELLGGSKGLIELSRNLCAKKYRAEIQLEGQNGKVFDSSPVVGSSCKGKPRKRHHRHGGSAR